MQRSQVPEIMDDPNCPEEVLETGHRGLQRIHHLLGNTRFLTRAIASDDRPVRRVIDIGCGRGGLLAEIGRRLQVETVGVDLRPFPGVVSLNAVYDPLPEADVAIAVYMLHHLHEAEVVRLIRNVRRSCRRFIILEVVRHPAPLWLYRIFIAPLVPKVNAVDGARSVERGFTADELNGLVRQAVSGDPFRHVVAPLRTRQVVDIETPSRHMRPV
jgi:SAM-dependent methyltransferase